MFGGPPVEGCLPPFTCESVSSSRQPEVRGPGRITAALGAGHRLLPGLEKTEKETEGRRRASGEE